MKHSWGYATDQRLRDENQDSHGVFVFPRFTLAIVCDGMGGHVGGAEASALAVRAIVEALQELEDEPVGKAIAKAVHRANTAIYQTARKNRRFMGMGTTVVAVALEGNVAHITHVGDSRLYALRDGEAHLLTTDHTMVNLFVEAELLSPEDAANHPEAHVLARSLGVEKTVDVDLQEPIELEPGDVLLLCSDGAHGPVADEALGRVEWKDLQAGCERILELVRDEHGDDNATVVAIGLDIPTSPDIPPTPLPESAALDELVREAAAEADKDADSPRRPPAGPVPHGPEMAPPMLQEDMEEGVSDPLTPVEPYDDEVHYPPPEPQPEPARVTPPAGPTPDLRSPPAPPRRAPVMVAAIALIAVAGVVGAAVLGMQPTSRDAPRSDAVVDVISHEPVAVVPDPTAEPAPAEATPWEVPDGAWVFAPVVPEPMKRPAHRARAFVYPPPGGTLQLVAVQSAREGHCAQSLDAVRIAMKDSIDYGSLYDHAWECFDRADAAAIAKARVRTESEFRSLLPHFRGIWLTESQWEEWPQWYRPAAAGLEYRMEALETSTDTDRFREVAMDRFGPGAIADTLARDLMLEAQAAAGLSTLPDPSPEVIGWWARRVFVTTRALRGVAGEWVAKERPDVMPLLRVHLDTATRGAYSDPSAGADLPPAVREALDVGLGLQPEPTRLKSVADVRPVVRPKPAPEPPPKPVSDRPTIHKHGPE